MIYSWGSGLLIIIGVIAFGRVIITDIIPTVKSGFVESRVAKIGIAVNADIIAAQQTSSWGGNKPIYQITFHYKTVDGRDMESSLQKALSFEEIEKYKPGNGTTIKYDPKDPGKIAFYDKPLILGD
ncbi:DUF3592 domain-containing protein [Kosakonia sp. MUSA4]|nr:DUF3592 domain-containing protein [Kosakonia sp. MUSA4]